MTDAPLPGGPGQPAANGVIVHVEEVMGTVVSFEVHPGDAGAQAARLAVAQACRLLHAADATFSTWDPRSPMSQLRRGEASLAAVPAEIPSVLALCRRAREMSKGWFDPWAMPGGLDPTGLVKGWAIEQALGVLRRAGIPAALVNGGGDLAAVGQPAGGGPWRVGIRHPWRPDALACVIGVDAAIATSGTYERGEHLTDPFTGRPAARTVSATVTGRDLAIVDALATALAAGGDEVLAVVAELEGYEGYLIRPDGSEESTEGMAFLD